MHPALWSLLRLRLLGWARQLGRALRTVKGALITVFGLLLMGLWLGPAIFLAEAPTADRLKYVNLFGPPLLLLFCLLNLISSAGQRAISFSPGEVNLLFPAPFTRRELVIYKLIITFAGAVIGALFFALILRQYFSGYLAGCLSMTLAILFLQLFSMALALIAEWVGAQAYSRRRWWVILAVVVLIGGAVLFQGAELARQGFFDVVRAISEQPLFWVLLSPFRWLVETGTAPDLGTLALNALLSLATNAVLLGVVLFLDQRYLEAAASASDQVYKQIEQMRRSGTGAIQMGSGQATFSLPALPRWGGIGPLLWRQFTGAVRSPWWLVMLIMFGSFAIIPAVVAANEPQGTRDAVLPMTISMLVMMALIVPPMLPFDFRSDLDRMDQLKMLPLSCWRIVLGQILAPVLLVCLIQVLLLIVLVIIWQDPNPLALVILPFLPPLNLLLFAIENVFFLWFPTRMVASGPGDFQTLGRHMLLWLVKFLTLALVLGIAGGLGTLVYLLGGEAWVGAGITVWVVVTLAALGLLPLVGLAFENFDVSRDLPA